MSVILTAFNAVIATWAAISFVFGGYFFIGAILTIIAVFFIFLTLGLVERNLR